MLMPVVIPAYKRPDQLEKCKSALSASQSVTPLVFVHDNSEKNIGFTAAVNRGLRWAMDEGHPYALALNQDCYLRPSALIELYDFMETHPRCAIAGVKQLHDHDADVIVHGGCRGAYPKGVHIGGKVSAGDCNEAKQMPWVNGACIAFRLDVLREIGLLDEQMFLVGSDSDICYTARLRGWEVWYAPTVETVHEFGESMRPQSQQVADVMRKDMAYWRDKWVGSTAFARLSKHEYSIPSHVAGR